MVDSNTPTLQYSIAPLPRRGHFFRARSRTKRRVLLCIIRCARSARILYSSLFTFTFGYGRRLR